MAINEPNKLRVLVDANVLFAGVIWRRWPYEVLRHAANGDFKLVLSLRIIEEARTALADLRPDTAEDLEQVLKETEYEEVATPSVEEETAQASLSRDPKDVHVALAALNAKVDCLVSYDKDLTESEPLKAQVVVLLPPVFLRDHMGWTSEQLEAIRHRTTTDPK